MTWCLLRACFPLSLQAVAAATGITPEHEARDSKFSALPLCNRPFHRVTQKPLCHKVNGGPQNGTSTSYAPHL
jgi:hypothetical protein